MADLAWNSLTSPEGRLTFRPFDKISLGAMDYRLSRRRRAGALIMSSDPIRREDGIDDLASHSPHGVGHSAPGAPELSSNASLTAPQIIIDATAAPMAPGAGSFNIDAPAPRARPVGEDVR